nr:immunoglobulin light chain junction region [Macaca mulatta]
CLQRLNSYSF